MVNPLKALSKIFSTKASKLIAVVIVAGLMTTTSAAVFTQYYANTTATVATPDITLVAGPDGGVTVDGGVATVSITMYPNAPTYYTNLLQIHNGGSANRTIQSVTVSSVVDSTPNSLGTIMVYYCAASTPTPATSNLGSITVTHSGATGSVGSQTLTAGSTNYIELVASAVSGATTGNAVTFTITIQWA